MGDKEMGTRLLGKAASNSNFFALAVVCQPPVSNYDNGA
jgi:hypothetical protein